MCDETNEERQDNEFAVLKVCVYIIIIDAVLYADINIFLKNAML